MRFKVTTLKKFHAFFSWNVNVCDSHKPYARLYNPQFVYFLPTFWSPKTFFHRVFFLNYLAFCMVSTYSRAVSNQERVMMALVQYWIHEVMKIFYKMIDLPLFLILLEKMVFNNSKYQSNYIGKYSNFVKQIKHRIRKFERINW